MSQTPRRRSASIHSRTVVLSLALLFCVAALFAFAFAGTGSPGDETAPAQVQSALATDVARAMAGAMTGASASAAEALIEAHSCQVCHVLGEGRVAPLFAGIAERAATRRGHLSAAQYVYESIVSPGVFLVEGYANIMPGDYAERLSQAEIGHIVAYLLAMPADQAP